MSTTGERRPARRPSQPSWRGQWPEVRAGLDEVFATPAFIGGPQVAEFEQDYADFARDPATASAWPTAPTRSSWRCAPSASAAGTRWCFRPTPSSPPPRPWSVPAPAGPGRRRPSAPADRPRSGRSRRSPRARRPSCRSTSSARWRRSRGSRPRSPTAAITVVEDAAQSQGAPRHGRSSGSVGADRGDQLLPGQEPRRSRRRRRRHHGRRRARPPCPAARRPRQRAEVRARGDRASTPGSTPSRPSCSGPSCGASRTGTRHGGRPLTATTSCWPRCPAVQTPATASGQRTRLAPLRRPGPGPGPGPVHRCTTTASVPVSTTRCRCT